MDKIRVILTVLTATTLIQCKSNLEINGAWLETTLTKKSDKPFSIFGRNIFDFRKDSVLMTTIGSPEIPDLKINKSVKGKYEIKRNKLEIKTGFGKTDKLKVRLNYATDSLTITIDEFDKDKITFKRLQERDKCDIQKDSFIGKSFLLSINNNFVDSIFFLNDSLMLFCGETQLSRPLNSWELTDYNGYKIFHTTNQFLPGMIISKYSGDTITLNPYLKSNFDVKLIPTLSQINNKMLIGNWSEIERKSISSIEFSDTKEFLRLQIQNNKIAISNGAKTKIMEWRTTPDFSRIYFIADNSSYLDSWKIIDFKNSIIKLRITDKTGMNDYIVTLAKE